VKRLLALGLVLGVLGPGVAAATTAAAAPSPVPIAQSASFDKTKFVLDVGTAAYAIHHFIWEPYEKNHISGLLAKVKAVAAAAFALDRLHAAYSIAESGNSKLLKAIAGPIAALVAELDTIKSKLKGGDTSAVPDADASLQSLYDKAKSEGVPFSDITTGV